MKNVYSRGQSLSEYALVLTLIVAAVFGMQAYLKRGIQGVIKTTADILSEDSIEEGVKEEGLVAFEYTDPLVVTSLEGEAVVTGQTRISLAREETTSTGSWEFTYEIEDAGSFRSTQLGDTDSDATNLTGE